MGSESLIPLTVRLYAKAASATQNSKIVDFYHKMGHVRLARITAATSSAPWGVSEIERCSSRVLENSFAACDGEVSCQHDAGAALRWRCSYPGGSCSSACQQTYIFAMFFLGQVPDAAQLSATNPIAVLRLQYHDHAQ